MELIVEYRYPCAGGETPQGLRLTVSTANMLDYVRQDTLRRDAWQWYQGRLKARGVASLPPDDPDWITLTLGLRRAYMLACLRGVEVLRAAGEHDSDRIDRMRPDGQDNSESILSIPSNPVNPVNERATQAETWEPADLPTEWDGIEGLAQNCPADLFVAWADAAERCNPRLFWPDGSDAGKARAGATVRPSARS
jgi:hypothetical protein